MSQRKRYAMVGLGARNRMFREAITITFSEWAEAVALCDSNPGRLERSVQLIEADTGRRLPAYGQEDFDRMVQETRPDCIIVSCMDSMHDFYMVRAMELGCDVVTEKPMTIDEERCQNILDTARRTGQQCRVTFNYRYSPPRTQVKDLLISGVIGDVKSVDFHWMLDTRHGADYFRRWHRNKKNSGGLMVHKATHHFDLVNWFLGSTPRQVFASGRRCYYRPETAQRLGMENFGPRCHGCQEAEKCPFFVDIARVHEGYEGSLLKEMYFDCEKYDGYIRDRCVFGDDIDIEDNMNVCVDYDNDVRLSYSLNAYCSWEGYHICFNGSKGRLEHKCQETAYMSGDGTVQGALQMEGTWTRVFPLREPAYEVEVWSGEGSHGGGDKVMLTDLFHGSPPEDKYLRAADERAGAWSILVGVAANHSMRKNRPVRIDQLVTGLQAPDYPEMPGESEPLSLPIVAG